MESVRRKVTAKLAKGFNSKTREEWLEGRGCVPWGGPVNRIAFLEYLSRGRGITLALLEPRDWNQDQWGQRFKEERRGEWRFSSRSQHTVWSHYEPQASFLPHSKELLGGTQWIVLLTFGKPQSTILRTIWAPSQTSLLWTTAWVTISEIHRLLIPLSCPAEQPLNYTQTGPLLFSPLDDLNPRRHHLSSLYQQWLPCWFLAPPVAPSPSAT